MNVSFLNVQRQGLSWSPAISLTVAFPLCSLSLIYPLNMVWWLILCQLNWAKGKPKELVKHYFWVHLWGCTGGYCHLIQWLSKEDLPSPMQAGFFQSTEGPNGTKRRRKGESAPSLPELRHPSRTLRHPHSSLDPLDSRTYISGPQAYSLRLGVTPRGPLVLRPLDSGWISSSFPGSPVYRWQIMGLLGLHNNVS